VAVTASAVGNGATGVGGWISVQNIQAANYTKFSFKAAYSNEPLTVAQSITGTGWRGEADRITGVRLFPAAGTFTGKITMYASQ
jgi:hypothetical protein